MRHLAWLGPIVLALGACAHIPKDLSVAIEGSTLVFKKAEAPVETPPDAPER